MGIWFGRLRKDDSVWLLGNPEPDFVQGPRDWTGEAIGRRLIASSIQTSKTPWAMNERERTDVLKCMTVTVALVQNLPSCVKRIATGPLVTHQISVWHYFGAVWPIENNAWCYLIGAVWPVAALSCNASINCYVVPPRCLHLL